MESKLYNFLAHNLSSLWFFSLSNHSWLFRSEIQKIINQFKSRKKCLTLTLFHEKSFKTVIDKSIRRETETYQTLLANGLLHALTKFKLNVVIQFFVWVFKQKEIRKQESNMSESDTSQLVYNWIFGPKKQEEMHF